MYTRVNQLRLDTYGAYLVGKLATAGFWDARFRKNEGGVSGGSWKFHHDVVDWGVERTKENTRGRIVSARNTPPEPVVQAAVDIARELAGVREDAIRANDGNTVVDAENFIAEALLDYFEHCARPTWLGRLRGLLAPAWYSPGSAPFPGNPPKDAARAVAWWRDFQVRRRVG
jgi:hypothetical protein